MMMILIDIDIEILSFSLLLHSSLLKGGPGFTGGLCGDDLTIFGLVRVFVTRPTFHIGIDIHTKFHGSEANAALATFDTVVGFSVKSASISTLATFATEANAKTSFATLATESIFVICISFATLATLATIEFYKFTTDVHDKAIV